MIEHYVRMQNFREAYELVQVTTSSKLNLKLTLLKEKDTICAMGSFFGGMCYITRLNFWISPKLTLTTILLIPILLQCESRYCFQI